MSDTPGTPAPGTGDPSPDTTAVAPGAPPADASTGTAPAAAPADTVPALRIVTDGGAGGGGHGAGRGGADAGKRKTVPVAMEETPQEAMRSALDDGRTRQYPLLVIARIRDGEEEALRKVLDDIHRNDVEDNYILPFARLRTVHFARFVIHPAARTADAPHWRGANQVRGPDIPAKLLFSTDFDGSLDDHLQELVEKVGSGLDAVFAHCEGYPAAGQRTPERVIGWIKAHRLRTNTFYTGTMNRSVVQIRREAALHRAIDDFIHREGLHATRPEDALAVRARIQQFVAGRPDLEWVRIPPGPSPRPIISDERFAAIRKRPLPLALAVAAVLVGVVALVLWLAGSTPMRALVMALLGVVVVAAVGYALFRAFFARLVKLEASDPVIIRDDWQDIARARLATEDRIVQNEMSSVIYIKEPSWLRRPLLKLVLFVIDLSARYLANQGNLAGIPSIHFARWVMVDDNRRLVFFSNFDGSWQNYLGDFIDKSAGGLTGVWSNCVGFPRASKLTGEGARDEQKFKQYSRQSQIATQVWYSAYKWLSVENVNNNSKIRLGLYGEMTPEQAQLWLRRFAGKPGEAAAANPGEIVAPRPVTVELDDVQGLVVRSFAGLPHATYVPVRFANAAGARRWLGALAPRVTRGSQRSDAVTAAGEAVAVALTSDGLKALEVEERVRRTFTVEFQEGMAWEHRKGMLGDVDEADPKEWRWGGPGNPVHAMLLLFAASEAGLEALYERERAGAATEGVVPVTRLPSITLPRDKEHFGFNDGIAQPRVSGFGGEGAVATGEKEIPTGEVLLGYANAYGEIPDSPWVYASADPQNVLAPAPDDPDREDQTPRRDLGRNGTYLVFRQLEQDVKRFWRFLDERTGAGGAADAARRKLLAAKMVGRWPNGAPLVVFPDAEPAGYDPRRDDGDRFLYVKTSPHWQGGGDPHGDKCPLGSHVRRTNPRDGMQTGPTDSLIVADRHRMLRRGRAYGPPVAASFEPEDILAAPDDGQERGLHFVCFGTDIVRQFEFVQGTWVTNGKFDGLYQDPDPIIARHCDPAKVKYAEQLSHFTEPRCPVRHRERTLERFVTMRGGGYFFMPGVAALRYLASL